MLRENPNGAVITGIVCVCVYARVQVCVIASLSLSFFQLTYLAHACMELKLGSRTMIFDPWLLGPAFARGWWLFHEPPSDSLERLCHADLVYISHMHSDHLR